MLLSSPKLIIGLMPVYRHKLVPTSAEIFIASVGQSSDKFLQTCMPTITDNGIVKYYQNQPYVLDMIQGVRNASRTMDYSEHEERLRTLLNSEQKHIWLGTVRPDQFEILKQLFGEDVVTLSMNYDQSLVENITMDYLEIAEYYGSNVFKDETLKSLVNKVPESFRYPADIEIDLSDIYDFYKLKNLLEEKFNESFVGDKLTIWNEWKTKQELLRVKYENN
jgi:hypothetical protein